MAESQGESPSPIAEISHGPSAFEQFLDKNQKLLILVAILLAVATGAWVVQKGVREGIETAAGAALVDAADTAALESLISEHGDTPAAISAGLLLADRQWDDGQQDAALATLSGLIADHPEHPATAPARARLGSRLAQQGKFDEAKPVLQALTQSTGDNYLAPFALLTLAQIARAEGDLDRAEELLKQTDQVTGASNFFSRPTNDVRRFLRFEMPEEVDPPELPDLVDPEGAGELPPEASSIIDLQGGEAAAAGDGSTENPLLDVLGGTGEPAAGGELPTIDDSNPADGEAGAGDEPAGASGGTDAASGESEGPADESGE